MIIQLLMILFLSNKLKGQRFELIPHLKIPRLFSFFGINRNGEKELIHFTNYSNIGTRVFITVSSDCKHCEVFLDNLYKLYGLLDNKKQFVYILTTDSINRVPSRNIPFKVLEISNDDMFQFGTETPKVVITAGNGDIVYQEIGYSEKIFEEINDFVKNYIRKKKSSKIVIL